MEMLGSHSTHFSSGGRPSLAYPDGVVYYSALLDILDKGKTSYYHSNTIG